MVYIFDKYGINLVNIYTKIYNKYLNQEEIKLDFLVSTSEISVEQYEKCVNAKVCWIPSNDNSQSCNWNVPNKKDHPMNCITWKEAEIYAKWLNASLPTKIQWEKFSKNGEGSKYPWGTEDINCNIIAYSNSWSLYCNKFSTSKICDKNRKYSNGLCDIYGNVWEILNDDCSNSTCGENSKIIKGGSWKSSAKDILSEKEMLYFNRADDIGFRIVINVQ